MKKKKSILCFFIAIAIVSSTATTDAYALTSTSWKSDYGFYQLNKNTREV